MSKALLPVLGWRDVPIFHEVRQELTMLERFVLEMALKLGTVTAEDFIEVVSLPRQVLAAGATRLIAGGALRLVGDTYHVEPTIAAQSLREERIRRRVPATADFVLLPRTGDLLAMPPAKKSWLRQLELSRVASAGGAPVPVELWKQRRSRYLAERVRAGTAVLLDTDLVDVAIPDDDPPLVPANGNSQSKIDIRLCASYHCRAEVTRDDRGQHTVRAVLHGKSRRRKETSKQDQTAGQAIEVPVQLTGAEFLISEWLALTATLTDSATQRAAWREICPEDIHESFRDARQRGPMEWEFPLTEQAAVAIARLPRRLDQAVGLSLENDHTAVRLTAWLVPDDDQARILFALDRVAGVLLTYGVHAAAALAVVREEVASGLGVSAALLSPRDIHHRAWDLRYYGLAYALREAEDFPYD